MPNLKRPTAQRKATINPNNLQEMLDSSRGALRLGQRQWLTPPEYAKALGILLHKATAVCDFQMGRGALLAGAPQSDRLGIEIDVDCAVRPAKAGGHWHILNGDFTLMAGLLEEIGWRCDTFALNPPFSLPWEAKRFQFLATSTHLTVREGYQRAARTGTIDSSIATYLCALHFGTHRSEGYMLMNESTAMKCFGDPQSPGWSMDGQFNAARKHLWLWLSFPRSFFPETGGDLRVCALYFATDHQRYKPHYLEAALTPEEVAAQLTILRDSRYSLRGGADCSSTYQTWDRTVPYFRTALSEYAVRHAGAKPDFNIWMDKQTGLIGTYLTPFQKISGRIPSDLVSNLDKLKGQSPLALVVQRATREALRTAVNSDIWTVDPALPPLVDQAIRDYNAVRSPFYPLSEIQRIGYLDESSLITCRKHGLPGFRLGQAYPLASTTVPIGRRMMKLNCMGEEDEVEMSGQDLQLTVTNSEAQVHRFMHRTEFRLPEHTKLRGPRKASLPMLGGEKKEQEDPLLHDLQTLVEYFEIPHVPDIAELRPDEYQAALTRIAGLEEQANTVCDRPFAYRNFQRDDLARAVLHDGGILSWQAGLGKSLGGLTYALLKGGRLNLIVAPDSLHEQLIREAKRFFGITLTPLMSQRAFYEDEELQASTLDLLNSSKRPEADGDALFWITSYTALGLNGGDEWEPKTNEAGILIFNKDRLAARRAVPGFDPEHEIGIGKVNEQGIKCVWAPTLSTLVQDLFDCVVIDEGVRIKSSDTYIGTGVRQLQPRFRLVLTATPIKNRLEDIFWLAWWVCGGTAEPNPRWPYEGSHESREFFADEHSLSERNLTKEERAREAGRGRSFVKRTPQICNIHRLWKLLGPVVIRRRKEDIGEDIVPKLLIPLRVKAGTAQQAVYSHHLKYPPEFSKDGEELSIASQIGVQLGLLRQAALCPDSPNLGQYGGIGPVQSHTDFTTKNAAIFGVIVEKLSLGEQVLVMEPFQHASARLHARLCEAGIRACLLDGNMSPGRRGTVAALFKEQKYSVMVAGIKAMGEGHSFECCNNLIRASLEWAFDINDQSGDRVHRLNSEKPVNIYDIITANTVEERLADLYHEKGDSANLALDGRLFADRVEEVNLAQLLRDAIRNFNPKADTIDEKDIQAEWPELKRKLHLAQAAFNQWHPPIAELPFRTGSENGNVTSAEISAALRALAAPQPAARKRRKVTFRGQSRDVSDALSDLLASLNALP
jgi:SNF2 domain-containing protein/helicase-like protein